MCIRVLFEFCLVVARFLDLRCLALTLANEVEEENQREQEIQIEKFVDLMCAPLFVVRPDFAQ